MTNAMKMDLNRNAYEDAVATAMNDVFAVGKDKDAIYKVTCKYANLTRDQFDKMMDEASAKVAEMKNELGFETEELSVEELEAVCGGYGGLVRAIADAIGTSAKAVGDFISDTLVPIVFYAGCAACVAGLISLCFISPIAAPLLLGGACAIIGAGILNNIAEP